MCVPRPEPETFAAYCAEAARLGARINIEPVTLENSAFIALDARMLVPHSGAVAYRACKPQRFIVNGVLVTPAPGPRP